MVRAGLLLVQERAVLWHELVHAERGDERCVSASQSARQEASADREAARRSLPLEAVLAAVVASPDYVQAADLLHTLPDVLALRLQTMQPAEKAALRAVVRLMDCAADGSGRDRRVA